MMMRRDACIYCSCRAVVIVNFNECTYTECVQTGFGDLIAANQIKKQQCMPFLNQRLKVKNFSRLTEQAVLPLV